jgi:hypothetical protein
MRIVCHGHHLHRPCRHRLRARGLANIPVDEAIDTAVGLRTASGADSITLSGTFYLAASYAPENMAKILLSAFRASARSGGTATVHRISPSELRKLGIKLKH